MACQFLALSMDGNSAALISAAGSMGFYGVEILSTEESAARGCEAGHQLLHYHNPLSFAISRLVEAARNAGFSKAEIFEPKEKEGDSENRPFRSIDDLLEMIVKSSTPRPASAPLPAELQKSRGQTPFARFNVGFRFSTIGSPWYIRIVNWILGRKEKGVTVAVNISA